MKDKVPHVSIILTNITTVLNVEDNLEYGSICKLNRIKQQVTDLWNTNQELETRVRELEELCKCK